MEQPLVSFIMGVYNSEMTIDSCILSVIEQSYTKWELIICDDGSTDKTIASIQKYMESEKRIVLLQNECNRGLAASLNRCLDVANGKYIARVDADDENLPQRLERQVGFLETNPQYDVVGCNRICFDENGDRGIYKCEEYPTKQMLLRRTPFAHPTILMKKSVYDALGGYVVNATTKRAEDLELWFRFFEKGFCGYNMQECLYRYRESIDDYNKRSLQAAWQTSKVFLQGYKRLGFPVYKYVWAIKPVLAAILPNRFMYLYHDRELKA